MKTLRATEYIDLYIEGEFVQARRHLSQIPCPKCLNDSGFTTIHDENGHTISKRCRCQGIDHRIKVFNLAGVPARYLDAELSSYKPRDLTGVEAVERASEFAWSFLPQNRGLLIYGGYGTGKTYLAASMIRVIALLRGYRVRFIEFSHLLSALQAEFSQGDRRYSRSHDIMRSQRDRRGGLMQELIDADCLIIDELGEGRQSEWAKSVLEELITKVDDGLLELGAIATTLRLIAHVQVVDGAEDPLLLLLGAVLDLILELLELALDDRAAGGGSVGRQPEDVAAVLEELVDLLKPDVVLHDGAELLQS